MTREFGARVKTLRTRLGLSQADLAGTELSHSYISLIEAGKRLPSGRTLTLIAERLGCDPDVLNRAAADDLNQSLELALAEAQWAVAKTEKQPTAEGFAAVEEQAGAAGLQSISVRACWEGGQLLERTERFAEAMDAYERTLRGLGRASPGEPDRLEVIGALCRCAVALGEFDHAAELGAPALEDLKRYGGAPSLATVDIVCALVWSSLQRGELAHARRLASSAVQDAERLKDPHELARAYWTAGQVAHESGRTSDALMLVRKALKAADGSDDELSRSHLRALYGSALLRADEGNVAKAEQELHQALAVMETHGRKRAAARCLQELARCALVRGDGEEAAHAATRAAALLVGASPAERAATLVLRAAAEAMSGRAAQSRISCDLAVELLANAAREPRSTALTWAETAEVYLMLGEAERALDAWRSGFALLGAAGPLSRSVP